MRMVVCRLDRPGTGTFACSTGNAVGWAPASQLLSPLPIRPQPGAVGLDGLNAEPLLTPFTLHGDSTITEQRIPKV